MGRRTPGRRWRAIAIAAMTAVAVALLAALAVELQRAAPPAASGPPTAERQRISPELAELREKAGLPPCTGNQDGTGPPALRGVIAECAADGVPVDVAAVLAGRRVLLNLWAYWCVPCRSELPAIAEYQRRAGREVMVVTVHQDANEAAALALLAELGVRLPTLQDPSRRIAAALRLPNVMPASVLLAPDGSVVRVLPQAFASADEVAVAVGDPAGDR